MGSGVSKYSTNYSSTLTSSMTSNIQLDNHFIPSLTYEIFMISNKIDSIKLLLTNHIGSKLLLDYLTSINTVDIYYLYIELSIIIVIISQHSLHVLLVEMNRFYERYFVNNDNSLIIKYIDKELQLEISCYTAMYGNGKTILSSLILTEQHDLIIRNIYIKLRQEAVKIMGEQLLIPFIKSNYYYKWFEYIKSDLNYSEHINSLASSIKQEDPNFQDQSDNSPQFVHSSDSNSKLSDIAELPSYIRRNKYYMKTLYINYKRKDRFIYKYIGTNNWLAEFIYTSECLPIGVVVFANRSDLIEVSNGLFIPNDTSNNHKNLSHDSNDKQLVVTSNEDSLTSTELSSSDVTSDRSHSSSRLTTINDFPFVYPKLKSPEYSLVNRLVKHDDRQIYKVNYVNKYLEYNLGYSLNEILDNSFTYIDYVSYHSKDIENLLTCLKTKQNYQSIYSNIRKDGSIIKNLISCKYITNGLYISLVKDITNDSDDGIESSYILQKFMNYLPNQLNI